MKYTIQSSDEELIRGCLQQERLAQKYLYERYSVRTIGIAIRYTKDRSEAVATMNQAFLEVFKGLVKYKDQGTLGAWIAKIVLRTAIREAKAKTRYQSKMDFERTVETPVQNEALLHLDMEIVYHYLQQLPAATRTVFSMYVLDGFKHREIAEQLGISISTSKWHLAHGRKVLQKLIPEKNPQL